RQATSAIDVPAIEAGDAEFDIAALARKSHRAFDQVPDVTLVAVGKIDLGVAVATLDRPLGCLRLEPAFGDPVEIDDLDLRQVRHMRHLVAEVARNFVQHLGTATNPRLVEAKGDWI